MFLKNYTCQVPVSRTIARIEQLLAESGASNVSKNYNGGEIESLRFSVALNGKSVTFQMPADANRIFEVMWKEVSRPHPGTKERLQHQASRTAWKLLQDSLEVECTRLNLHQTEFMQVFLPYVWDGERTFYQSLKERKFKGLLPAPSDNHETETPR